jgi:hypothetical protein
MKWERESIYYVGEFFRMSHTASSEGIDKEDCAIETECVTRR